MENLNHLTNYFHSGRTLLLSHRLECLDQFQKMLDQNKSEMIAALKADFNKPDFETVVTEIAMLQKELNFFKKNIKKLYKPKRVLSSLLNFPSKEFVAYHPYGVVLVIAPWNYPLLLALQPMLAALVTGNCVVLKPSELTPNTSKLLATMVSKYFSHQYVQVIEGGVAETQQLLDYKFQKIFFTGSTKVGKIVYEAAAKNLTPVVLELGGKSPCIITKSANIKLAAKRIAFGKFVNAGQTCIAPDFIFIDEAVEKDFVNEFTLVIKEFYGDIPEQSNSFARIVNDKNYQRLKSYILNSDVLIGGETNSKTNYISPTVLKVQNFDDEVMQDEIFGPILPIINFRSINDIIKHNQESGKPLAFYVFGEDEKQINELLDNCQYGGACVNDCLSHIINHRVPFGGIDQSGIGNYHGKYSYETFSHTKSLVHRKTWYDNAIKYPPYSVKKLNLLAKILKYL